MPDYIVINPDSSATAGPRSVPVVSGTCTNALSIVVPSNEEENLPPPTTDDEEQEWEDIVSKPHVRNALRRLAAKVLQQEADGETKEGGFGVE